MTDTVRYPLVLGLMSLCSAAALAFSYALTRDEIERQRILERNQGLAAVFGMEFDERAAQAPWKEASPGIFAATDPKSGRALYATQGSARGYSGQVDVIVAVDQTVDTKPDAARIKAIKVVNQSETPGLGSKCQTPEFQDQFADLLLGRLALKRNAPYRKPGTPASDEMDVAAITGATITSDAVIRAVRQAIAHIREQASHEPKAGGQPSQP